MVAWLKNVLWWTLQLLKWTDNTQKKAATLSFDSLYVRPKQWVLPAASPGDTVPSDAVLCVYVAAEGSAAICSGHVWFKSVSGGVFCYISLGSKTKCLTEMEGKKNHTKQKLKCLAESETWFDVELCSRVWGDHWRRRRLGEIDHRKLNKLLNEWLYVITPLEMHLLSFLKIHSLHKLNGNILN